MNFRQVILSGPIKATELFAKLAETSGGAVKTREKLFAELKAELELHADLEEQHLLPVLRKHDETKDLVPAIRKANKEQRSRLAELDSLPKGDETFLEKLFELQSGFQQHVRDEKNELLPAVRQALSNDEAQEMAAGIEAGRAEVEQAKHDEAEQRRAEAREAREHEAAEQQAADQAKREQAAERRQELKREREEAERQAAEQEAVERARKAGDRRIREVARNTAETAQRVVEAAHDEARKATESFTNGARRSAAAVADTVEIYRNSAQKTAEDFRAVAAFSNTAAGGVAEIQSAWMEWLGKAMSAGLETPQQLLRCRTVRQVAETQRAFLADGMRIWMEGNVRMLQISRRMADDALRPLQGRLEAGQEDRRDSR